MITMEGFGGVLLAVEQLSICVEEASGGYLNVVRNVSFNIEPGSAVGMVGESGSGKTLTCRAILGILPKGCRVTEGSIRFDGGELLHLDRRSWRMLRGREIGAVFQDPGSYLTPSVPVGRQLGEAIRIGLGTSRKEARGKALDLLRAMNFHHVERVYAQLPAELSGGMLQRVLIAIAICCEPRILIADEPTTALDVTVQAEVIDVLRVLRKERQLAVLLVTHDLSIVEDFCDSVVVMYAGEVVEIANIREVFTAPLHPYTEALTRVSLLRRGSADQLEVIPGSQPVAGESMEGCRFRDRCSYAVSECRAVHPELVEVSAGRAVRCLVRAPSSTAAAKASGGDSYASE